MTTPDTPGQVTELLRQWRQGDGDALTELAPLVYAELRALARSRLSGELRKGMSATELVHEAFLRLVRHPQPEWASRSHFYYISARLMRQVLVDHAREVKALKRGGGEATIALDAAMEVAGNREPGVIQIHDALNALAAFDERKARVLEMRFFSGMTAEEIAEVEGIAAVTVTRDVRAATAWLRNWLLERARP